MLTQYLFFYFTCSNIRLNNIICLENLETWKLHTHRARVQWRLYCQLLN